MIEKVQPQAVYTIEMERLGGGEVIHAFTTDEDDKTVIVSRDYWNWTRMNTYTLSLANGETTKATSTWRDLIPSIWTPRTSLEIQDEKERSIGAFATGFFRIFPAAITDPSGKTLATLNYSGDTWMVRSVKTGRSIATLEPQKANANGITPWKFSVYNTSEVNPRLLAIAAAFISHYYSELSWSAYFASKNQKGLSFLWSGICTVASFGINGICDLADWTLPKLESFAGKAGASICFLANEVFTPAAYNFSVLCTGIALVIFSFGTAYGSIGIAKVLGVALPRILALVKDLA